MTPQPNGNLESIRHDLDELRKRSERRPADLVWQWLGRLVSLAVVPSIVAFSSWLSSLSERVIENQNRLNVIDATRYTSADGSAMEARLLRAIAVEHPMVSESLGRLERIVDKIDGKVDSIDARLVKLESRMKD